MPRLLTAVDLAATSLDDALDLLRAALDGTGDAILPVAAGDPTSAAAAQALRAGHPLAHGEDDGSDPTAVVVATSGSTGAPKGALLPRSALAASTDATHERLGGPGHWLLALAPHHVAGVQVLLRSLRAGTRPTVLPAGGFDVGRFASATADLADRGGTPGSRRYTALVPTQLTRLLADPAGARAAASFDAVLLGGAAAVPALLAAAREAGIAVVTTYGMSETCGGCVYDGVPLTGARAELSVDGRIALGGPMVARGYRDRPSDAAFTARDGLRWFRTDDLGRTDDGRLHVLGRADDVLVTGGHKVSPQAVEAVLAEHPAVRECLVVGVPDAEWGQRVVALVVADGDPPTVADLRALVTERLGRAAVPRAVLAVDALPTRGLGKPDRARAQQVAAHRLG